MRHNHTFRSVAGITCLSPLSPCGRGAGGEGKAHPWYVSFGYTAYPNRELRSGSSIPLGHTMPWVSGNPRPIVRSKPEQSHGHKAASPGWDYTADFLGGTHDPIPHLRRH